MAVVLGVRLGFPTSFKSSKIDWSFHSTGTTVLANCKHQSIENSWILHLCLLRFFGTHRSWWNLLTSSRNFYKKPGTALDPLVSTRNSIDAIHDAIQRLSPTPPISFTHLHLSALCRRDPGMMDIFRLQWTPGS